MALKRNICYNSNVIYQYNKGVIKYSYELTEF